jgi:hypothetical protein
MKWWVLWAMGTILPVFINCATFNLNWDVNVGNQGTTTIAVGDTVKWTWTDSATHSVQAASSAFTSSSFKTGAGNTHSVTFMTAGSFMYYCGYHGFGMQGVIAVTTPPTPTPSRPPTRPPTPSPTTRLPTFAPTTLPPTSKPSVFPTRLPTSSPTILNLPTVKPTPYPTPNPTPTPPTLKPVPPTRSPTNSPTTRPPTAVPTTSPTVSAPTVCKCASKYQKTVSTYSATDYLY